MTSRFLTLALLAVCLPASSFAQTATTTNQTPPKQEEPKKDPELEKYEKATKDAKKYEGEITVWERKKEVLFELDQAQLGKVFFLQATLYSGFSSDAQAGDPLNADNIEVFRFDRQDENIRLIKPNLNYRWTPQNPLATASRLTFPEAILGTFKIEATHPTTKKILVNVTTMLQGPLVKIPQLVQAVAGPGYSPDRENTGPEKIRVTPEMATIRMAMHYTSSGMGGESSISSLLAALGAGGQSHLADRRSLPFAVTYSLWFDRDTGYRPRFADPRIGYFTTDFFDVGKFNTTQREERLIMRYHLVKQNPKAEMSEPVEPIIWYLDASIPPEYRDAVRRGILFWNKAFEKIGYRNALVVKDAPTDDPDWDHSDGRHNLVRWTMSPSTSYAVAWFRPNPITGQIMNAGVTVDANYPADTFDEYFTQVGGTQPKFASLFRPTFDGEGAIDSETAERRIREQLQQHGWSKHECRHAHGLAEQASFGWATLRAGGSKMPLKAYIDMMIADLIAHEVGHCLGLRHNFAASTFRTSAELETPAILNESGVSASVMDYVSVNTAALLKGNGVYYNPTIGPYDEWAIRYGYGDSGADSPEGEGAYLQSIAKQSGKPGLMFLTDQDADGMNPLAVRWDLGSDTLAYLRQNEEANNRIIDYAITEKTKPGQSYDQRNQLILGSLRRRYRLATMAIRFVGGVEMRRQFKGDTNEKPTLRPVSAADQRKAMRYLVDNVLAVNGVDLPQDVLFSLNTDFNGNGTGRYNAPLRQTVGIQQRAVLSQLVSGEKTDAIIENAFKTQRADQKYSLAEHYNILFSAVFNEIGANKSISDLRRDLQRFFIQSLVAQASAPAGSVSDDVRVVCSQGLGRLQTRIKGQLSKPAGLDDMTILHLRDIADQIDRYMKRQWTISR